jgi:hypothetical protein
MHQPVKHPLKWSKAGTKLPARVSLVHSRRLQLEGTRTSPAASASVNRHVVGRRALSI